MRDDKQTTWKDRALVSGSRVTQNVHCRCSGGHVAEDEGGILTTLGRVKKIARTDLDFSNTRKLCPGSLMYYRGHVVNRDILKTIGAAGAGA